MGDPLYRGTRGWNTADELAFIQGIGSFNGRYLGQRIDLLTNYREGLEYRADWTGLDRAVIIREAEIEIGREIARKLRLELTQ